MSLPGDDPSLKLGLGAIPASRNPLAGTRPSGEDLIHIVPPVITTRTLASGYWDAIEARVALKNSNNEVFRPKRLGLCGSLRTQ
jgi:hypothetical protein